MKNWKLFTFVTVIAIFGIIIGFMACDNGSTQPETFTVTFHANGGTPEPPMQTVNKGGKVEEPTISKANSTLDGWYKESTFSTKWNFVTDTVTSDISLYAQWAFVQPDTTMPLAFTNDGSLCTVTITSDEKFTSNEWSTLCLKVVAAIMRGYNKDMGGGFYDASNMSFFENLFSLVNVTVVLSKTATYDVEVKSGVYDTLYLKISAIDTVDIQPAVDVMVNETGTYPPFTVCTTVTGTVDVTVTNYSLLSETAKTHLAVVIPDVLENVPVTGNLTIVVIAGGTGGFTKTGTRTVSVGQTWIANKTETEIGVSLGTIVTQWIAD